MIALARITTQVKTYLPGETLGKEFSQKEIERLKRLKAVEGSYDEEDDEELFHGTEPPTFLSEVELNKISPKAKLVEYAKSIGLEDLTAELTKEELVTSIRNYIEELEDSDIA